MDRGLVEFNPETEAFEAEALEVGEAEWAGTGGGGSVFTETDEMELAAGLLEVTDESELDRFLGGLIRKAGQAVGTFVRSPTGQVLGGILKGAAKQALPVVGRALGGYVGGASSADIGGRVAQAAGKYFGLELEGLSAEDQEFEAAKRFVRFAGDAAKNTATAPPNAPPQAVVQAAVSQAAKRFAPGLLRQIDAPRSALQVGRPGAIRSGRWLRRGRNIVVVNC